MVKDFDKWNKVKEKLHSVQKGPPLVKERDLWWVSFGENIGSEINGKSSLFSRPAIIFKKLSGGFYFVIPTTSQKKIGTWYVEMLHEDQYMYVCLHQARAIDYRRLSTRMGQIDSGDFKRIKTAFAKLYK